MKCYRFGGECEDTCYIYPCQFRKGYDIGFNVGIGFEDNGFFWCPVCSQKAAIWNNDFDAEDVGCNRPGIVTFYTCSNCGAEIEARRLEDSDDQE